MSPITINKLLKGRGGFTLGEMLIASIIGTMVIASAWSAYVMIWQWWHEMSPRFDVERKARLALLYVIEGVPDSTIGTYPVGSTHYQGRNGIAWAVGRPNMNPNGPDIYSESGPLISPTCFRTSCDYENCVGVKIKYSLDPAVINSREFYVDSFEYRGITKYAVHYIDSNGTHRLDNTIADKVDLTFERLSAIKYINGSNPDCKYIYNQDTGDKECLKNVIVVTVTVSDNIRGTRKDQPYAVSVTYTDTIYLRNVP